MKEIVKRWIKRYKKRWYIIAPQVRITPQALADLRLYAVLTLAEASGLGFVEIHGRAMVITELLTYRQRSEIDNTILDDQAMDDLMMSLSVEEAEKVSLWWHTHHRGLGWSSTDRKTIERRSYADFWVSIVANKYGQEMARVDFFSPLRITFDLLPLLTEPINKKDFQALLKKRQPMIKRKIQENLTWLTQEEDEDEEED